MRRPSRHMPRLEPARGLGFLGWAVLGGSLVAVLWIAQDALQSLPWALVALACAVAAIFAGSAIHHRSTRAKLRALAAGRAGESICEFARSFDTRVTDTWVIRAVYEQLQAYLAPIHADFPIRATDLLREPLIQDQEDLEIDIVQEISTRTNRSISRAIRNPYFPVRTVADLVHFFDAQPVERAR